MWQNKLSLIWFLSAVLAFSVFAQGQDLSRFDLSTDEGVNAARAEASGTEIDKHSDNCIARPKDLSGVIIFGSFAHDRGCLLEGAFVNKRLVYKKGELSKKTLDHLGWENASAEQRKGLAIKWVEQGLLAFENPLEKATADFTKNKFEEIKASEQENGDITVTLWTQRPAGMLCQTAYDRFSHTFSGTGNLVGRKTMESFSIPCR